MADRGEYPPIIGPNWDTVIEMRKAGATLADIGAEIGCTGAAIINYARRHGLSDQISRW